MGNLESYFAILQYTMSFYKEYLSKSPKISSIQRNVNALKLENTSVHFQVITINSLHISLE